MTEPELQLTIVMPVYNERATVEQAIASVLAAGVSDSFELVVVDDGSTDGTGELLRDRTWPDAVRLLRHERNRGKGAAIQTALAEAKGRFTTIMDADLEYEPADIPLLLEPLRTGVARAVFLRDEMGEPPRGERGEGESRSRAGLHSNGRIADF